MKKNTEPGFSQFQTVIEQIQIIILDKKKPVLILFQVNFKYSIKEHISVSTVGQFIGLQKLLQLFFGYLQVVEIMKNATSWY